MDIPIELFLSLFAFCFVTAIIGIWKKIPFLMLIGGSIMAFSAVITDNIIMNDRIDNVVATPATFNLTSSVNTIPDYSYNVLSSSISVPLDAGGTNPRLRTEYASTSSSALVGDVIECINIAMQDTGTASVGIAKIGTFDSAGNIVLQFGSINATNLIIGTFVFHEFCLPEGEAYTIQTGDRIGVIYNADATNQGIQIRADDANPFDGTITFHQSFITTTPVSSTARDITMQLYSFESIPDSVQIAGIGGIYTYENNSIPFTEYPKILFALIGSMMLIGGALIWKMED